MLDEYLEYLNEAYLISDKTISIDLDKFISGESNKLLIAGLSGSGKSTLCRYLAKKYKAECYETDRCVSDNPSAPYKRKDIDDRFWNKNPQMNVLKSVFKKVYFGCVEPLMKNNKRQVIEGGLVWENYLFIPQIRKDLDKHPIIIIGKSALKSSFGILDRAGKKHGTLKTVKKLPLIYGRNFKLLSKLLDMFRSERVKAGGNIQEFKIPKL